MRESPRAFSISMVAGTQTQVRRPLIWAVSARGRFVNDGGGGAVKGPAREALSLFLTRGAETCALSKVRLDVICISRVDVAFCCREEQPMSSAWRLVDRVEVRVRSTKGERVRKRVALTCTRTGACRTGGEEGGPVGLVAEGL